MQMGCSQFEPHRTGFKGCGEGCHCGCEEYHTVCRFAPRMASRLIIGRPPRSGVSLTQKIEHCGRATRDRDLASLLVTLDGFVERIGSPPCSDAGPVRPHAKPPKPSGDAIQ